MKHRAFFWFFLPTGIAMFFFIAMPILSVIAQSIFIPHEAVMETVKNCGPFGCKEVISINHEATSELRAKQPLGRFSGLEISSLFHLDKTYSDCLPFGKSPPIPNLSLL